MDQRKVETDVEVSEDRTGDPVLRKPRTSQLSYACKCWEYPGKNLSEQNREPTNSTHIWRRIWESIPGHMEGECSHHCASPPPLLLSLLEPPNIPLPTQGNILEAMDELFISISDPTTSAYSKQPRRWFVLYLDDCSFYRHLYGIGRKHIRRLCIDVLNCFTHHTKYRRTHSPVAEYWYYFDPPF